MFIRITLALALLSHFATACFAQSGNSQTINIAEGSSIKLKANTNNASTFLWLKDGAVIPNATTNIYMANATGKYSVIAFNAEGCGSVPSTPVDVIVVPQATPVSADMAITKTSDNKPVSINEIFEYQINIKNFGPSTANNIIVKDPLPLNLTFDHIVNPLQGTAEYNPSSRLISWNLSKLDSGATADLTIKVKANKFGAYKNTATVSANELDPVMSNNTTTHLKYIWGITIPNVFTPNGDGKNDAFEITGLSLYTINEITIVNRWGSPVYEKKGYQNDWTANGLSDGTYFYVLKIKENVTATAWQEFKGYVTVIH